jgi:DNA-binding CsgD family transcriptional regulator
VQVAREASGSVLLEREREQTAIVRLIADARGGSGRLLVLEGSAGIGKTRLLSAARFEAELAGMRALTARGSELEREFAFGVLRQLFEPVMVNDSQRDAALAGAAAGAGVVFEDAPHVLANDDVSFAILNGLFWLTANLCERQPLLLVVDDLHWSDRPSLRFLAHLLPRLDGLALLIAAAWRPGEPGSDARLLDHLATDPTATLLRPSPLSLAASTHLVRLAFGTEVQNGFAAAAHESTGGNPLLLRELAAAAAGDGLRPTDEDVGRLLEVGPHAVQRHVAQRLRRLGTAAAEMAGAVAVLGEAAAPATAAALAGLDPAEAVRVTAELAAADLLGPRPPHGFVHPLVRAAVYESLSHASQSKLHRRAAKLLGDAGAAPEQAAAHLLLVPPTGDLAVVDVMERAAEQAIARGSPESALAYLQRAVAEPPPPEQRAGLLAQLGGLAQLVDVAAAAEYLHAALLLTDDPERRGVLVEMLGRALYFDGRTAEAAELYAETIRALPAAQADLRRQLEAGLLVVGVADPALIEGTFAEAERLRSAAPHPGLGGRMLDCVLALGNAYAGIEPADAVQRALRGLDDGVVVEWANGTQMFASGCIALTMADRDEVLPVFEAALAHAHRHGSVFALGTVHGFRSLTWLCRGQLAEAAADGREAVQLITAARMDAGRPMIGSYLALTLMELGRLDEAAATLDWVGMPALPPRTGDWFWIMYAHARLLLLQGHCEQGLAAMLAAGRRFSAHGGRNPAMIPWRSQAALAMWELGRKDEARALAHEELKRARRWEAPLGLGRALRTAGLLGGDIALLREAVEVLSPSPARLEHAKALVDLGAAQRRAGERTASREYLRHGADLAQLCGATPLVDRARTELRASGARLRRINLTGVEALTPSEHRVAELAAGGRSNRDIAQTLFVTPKTVEVHLTNAYRKLGVDGRAALADLLAPAKA